MRLTQLREITPEEKAVLSHELRSSSAFSVRRSQIVVMTLEDHLTPKQIGDRLRCSDECVREALHAFNEDGVASLQARSHARHDEQSAFTQAGLERLKVLVETSPRTFGYDTSVWTLALLADRAYGEGLTAWRVDADTVGHALRRAGVVWTRAKHWLTSPDPAYAVKKNVGTG